MKIIVLHKSGNSLLLISFVKNFFFLFEFECVGKCYTYYSFEVNLCWPRMSVVPYSYFKILGVCPNIQSFTESAEFVETVEFAVWLSL